MGILINLLVLVVVFAVVWWILTMIPIPAEMQWVVRVVFAILFLIALVSLLTGSWALFPVGGSRGLR